MNVLHSISRLLLCVLAVLGSHVTAHAQCNGWDASFGAGFGTPGSVAAATVWDPDGSGPAPERIVLAGNFNLYNDGWSQAVVTWSGTAWEPLGAQFGGPINRLFTWDPDGPGPRTPMLIATGRYTVVAGKLAYHILTWNGLDWVALTPTLDGEITMLSSWLPEGATSPLLVVGGGFSKAGSVSAARIVAWNGNDWIPFGLGLSDAPLAIASWDSDGNGPAPSRLYAVGRFKNSGTVTLNHVGEWNGASWNALDGGVSGVGIETNSITLWDPDGEGPLNSKLIVGGTFHFASGKSVNNLIEWNGQSWAQFGPGAPCDASPRIFNLLIAGNGGTPTPTLLVISNWCKHIYRWRDNAWEIWEQPLAQWGNDVIQLLVCDPDADGPLASQPILIGGNQGILRRENSVWRSFGQGLNARPAAVLGWNPGFGNDRLIACGEISSTGDTTLNWIGEWHNGNWSSMNGGTNGMVYAIAPFRSGVVAAGAFSTVGGITAKNIALWSGNTWSPLGAGLQKPVFSLTQWDNDADPSTPAQLTAGCMAPGSGGRQVLSVHAWDGISWSQLGSDFGEPNWIAMIHTMTTWDFDGAGPQPPRIVIGGRFNDLGGKSANNVAYWDGAQWQPYANGIPGPIRAFTKWDPDGAGERLFAAPYEDFVGISNHVHVHQWDGQQWVPFGNVIVGHLTALTSWDPDGDGPARPLLIVAAESELLYYDNGQWNLLAPAIISYPGISSLTKWKADANAPARLVVAGEFRALGKQRAAFLGTWKADASPTILDQSDDVTSCTRDPVQLFAHYQSENPSFIWEKESQINQFTPLEDGLQPHGSIVHGSKSATLQIDHPSAHDSARYRLKISNVCNQTLGSPIRVHVLSADLDCNGQVDDADFILFTTQYDLMLCDDPQMPDTCPADFNHDGLVDDADFSLFIPAYDAMIFP